MAVLAASSLRQGLACSSRISRAVPVAPLRTLSRGQRYPLTVSAVLGKKAPNSTKQSTVTPEPSFNLQLGLLSIAGFSAYQGNWGLGAFLGFLGVFLAIQATRIQFTFDNEALEVLRSGKESDNVVVGGRNRWPYSSFINWEFWWPGFPILVYFKENQTKPEGQIHFFPIIFNGKQLYDVMVERCGPSKNSGPKN